MKTIDLEGLDISVYEECLSNGLEIFMIPYPDKKNYFISYATRFGSDVLKFTKDGEVFQPPLGIAHFLEHKMFEEEDGQDPFTFFSKSGTDSNASTSFDNTQYICSGTKEFGKNLRYLIHFVNSPYYTDENVEKEKGIIAEEIKMYRDIPDFKLEMKLRECIYHNSPRRIDIAGSVEEINRISKEDLYDCYRNFYVPNNMFLLIAGNFDKEEALQVIKEELDYRHKEELPVVEEIEEKSTVYKKKLLLTENIEVSKIGFGVKIPVSNLKMDSLELDLYLHMITAILFGSSSLFRENGRNLKLFSTLYTEWESIPNYKVFTILANSINPDKLIKEIQREISEMNVSKDSFERMKKVWISNEVKMIDHMNSTVHNLYDDIIKYKRIIPDKLNIIRNMKFEKLKTLLKKIEWNEQSIVKMVKK